jgi:hypothetical protein
VLPAQLQKPGHANDPDVSETVAGQVRRGYAAAADTIRAQFPAGRAPKIWPNFSINAGDMSESHYSGLADGVLIEAAFNGPWQGSSSVRDYRRSWSFEYLAGPAAFADGSAFWRTLERVKTIQSHLRDGRILLNTYTADIGDQWWTTPRNLATWRYIFGIAHLLDKAYPGISPGSSTGGITFGPKWFDELDQPLGQPVGPVPTAAWSNGVAIREYTNGLVLVNTTTGTVTVDPRAVSHGQWRFFLGGQDRARNSGAAITGPISLGGKDGVLLLKR